MCCFLSLGGTTQTLMTPSGDLLPCGVSLKPEWLLLGKGTLKVEDICKGALARGSEHKPYAMTSCYFTGQPIITQQPTKIEYCHVRGATPSSGGKEDICLLNQWPCMKYAPGNRRSLEFTGDMHVIPRAAAANNICS